MDSAQIVTSSPRVSVERGDPFTITEDVVKLSGADPFNRTTIGQSAATGSVDVTTVPTMHRIGTGETIVAGSRTVAGGAAGGRLRRVGRSSHQHGREGKQEAFHGGVERWISVGHRGQVVPPGGRFRRCPGRGTNPALQTPGSSIVPAHHLCQRVDAYDRCPGCAR